MSLSHGKVQTSQGAMAFSETSGPGLPLVFIHGNSADRHAFRRQLDSDIAAAHRLIAFDLPGHGDSDNSLDPERTYTQPGYARVVTEALGNMGVERAAVYGWSLGGHVALEMIPLFPGMAGVMVSGAPPISNVFEEATAGFQPLPNVEIVGKPELTEEEVAGFAFVMFGELANEATRAAIRRTDGRARAIMFANLISGGISDQRRIAVTSKVPVAMINGDADPLVNLDYVGGLDYANLWEDHHFVLRGAAHAPFLQVPKVFNPILGRFAADMEKRATGSAVSGGVVSAA